MAAIAGKDIMIFFKFDGTARALALASNHTLDLQSDTTETSSKDSGIWADSEVSKLRWTASSENFIEGLDGDYAALVEAWRTKQVVDVVLAVPTNISESPVPEGGWLPPSTGGGYTGKAAITGVTLGAPSEGNASMTISLMGKGELKPLTVA